MLCGRCNHDNPEQYNYCGMCGMRLERPSAKPPAAPAKPAPAKEAPRVRAAEESASVRTSILGLDAEPQASRSAASRPAITGPSFLGLNSEPAPDQADYLLDDDEPRSHIGLWIALVLLIALAVGGWRFGAQAAPVVRQLYASMLARVNPQPATPVAAAAPATDPATPSAADAPQPSATASGGDAPQPAAGSSAEAQSTSSAAPAPKPVDEAATAKDVSAAPAKPSPDVAEEAAPSAKTTPAVKPAHAIRVKPADATAPENDAVLKLAQKYLHGQGVHQDCITGMAYLKQAMTHPNAPADSQMGALYATGTCVPLDRLAAYRYFTAALQLAPSDPWLGMERDKLYGQMNSAERHQADQQ